MNARTINMQTALAKIMIVILPLLSSMGCALKSGPLHWAHVVDETSIRSPAEINWPARYAEPLASRAYVPLPPILDDIELQQGKPSALVHRLLTDREGFFRGPFGEAVITADPNQPAGFPYWFNIITTPFSEEEFAETLRARDEQWLRDRTPPTTEDELNNWIARQALKSQSAETPIVSVLDCTLFSAATESPRGLVVHLTSLARRSRYEHAVIQRLREDGWAILEIGHPTRMYSPQLYIITPTSKPEFHAPIIARELDERLAEWAVGVEAALRFLAETHPDIPQSPLVLTGFSLGGIVLSPVAARLGEAVDAAVVIAGGANLAEILSSVVLMSETSIAGFALAYAEGVTNDQRRALNEHYLAASQLDPYHTATALHGKPVLVLHAMFDHIVPADTGTLLYNRLGRPARWRYFFGHLGLFWWLPNEAGAVARWVDRQLPN